ncbi:16373_t:CDS:2, partial [Acaulospora colombiana]
HETNSGSYKLTLLIWDVNKPTAKEGVGDIEEIIARIRTAESQVVKRKSGVRDDDDDPEDRGCRVLSAVVKAFRVGSRTYPSRAQELLEATEKTISNGIDKLYYKIGRHDPHLPSFAHDQNNIVWLAGSKEASGSYRFGVPSFMYPFLLKMGGDPARLEAAKRPAYQPSHKPSQRTTPLASFLPLSTWSQDNALQYTNPDLRAVRQARTEITCREVSGAWGQLELSPHYIAVFGQTGCKDADTQVFGLESEGEPFALESGFNHTTKHVAFDAGGMLWMGGGGRDKRIKAFDLTNAQP